MLTQDTAVATYVAEHPWATLLVGPVFAAVTGLSIKEGLCYGKLEAAILVFVRISPLAAFPRGCRLCTASF
jgi:uncharacterized integral membrane protein